MAKKTKTFGNLVADDYNGEPLPYNPRERDAVVEHTLRLWCVNDADAKALIDEIGLQDSITRYIAAWDTAHEDEYRDDS